MLKIIAKRGRKQSSEFPLAFIVNPAGGKEVPIVIRKGSLSKVLPKASKTRRILLVSHTHSNDKAWMNSDIMFDVLM